MPLSPIWHIYFIPNCPHCRPSPKDKLVVIVCRDSLPYGFLINSHIHPWIAKDKDRIVCQAELKACDHACLNRDSYVDCLELYPFREEDLTNQRDKVSSEAQARIRSAVNQSKTIETKYRNLILANG
jgi:hypothetical protein